MQKSWLGAPAMDSTNTLSVIPVVELPRPVALRNLLVATDFSPASDVALDYALSIARRYESTVHVLHVVRPDTYQLLPTESLTSARETVRRWAEREMASLLISGRLRGTPHQVLIAEGALWPSVSSAIEKNEIDLVVLGAHGRTGATKLLLGSVAEQVFRLSDRPVLTVGPRVRPDRGRTIDLRQILFPTDFTPWAVRALPYAVSLAEEYHARLTLLHVVENPADTSAKGIAIARKVFSKELEALLPPGADLWCEPDAAVGFGDSVSGILEVAESRKADLIVMGVRGDGALTARLPGSKAYQIVCRAACPVLTVRSG
jgi:nucleotide-binding universal stress UspA family protein